MITNAQPMACGSCGRAQFAIYQTTSTGARPGNLVCECMSCMSTTIIGVTQPTLDLRFGPGSDGMLAVMDHEECRHTSCKHCGLDVEGFAPFNNDTMWLDRGANAHCNDGVRKHEGVL